MLARKPRLEHKVPHIKFDVRPDPVIDYRKMEPGVVRREAILRWLETYTFIYVNRKYCLPIEDTDFKVLISRGQIQRKRIGGGRQRCTVLELTS